MERSKTLAFAAVLAGLVAGAGMAAADFGNAQGAAGSVTVEEEDGSPTGMPSTLKVTNGDLTDNGDGTFSLATASGATPSWSDVLDNGTATNGLQTANPRLATGDGLEFGGTANGLINNGDIVMLRVSSGQRALAAVCGWLYQGSTGGPHWPNTDTTTVLASEGLNVGIAKVGSHAIGIRAYDAGSPVGHRGTWSARVVYEAHTAADTLTRVETGSVHSNAGAGGTLTLSAPTDNPVDGTTFTVVSVGGNALRFDPVAGDNIAYSGGAMANGEYLEVTDGSFRLVYDRSETLWLVFSESGTLLEETP